jgi:2-succinyl-5-enolpyruvyl-6-hydroxy-3-cyclohexene-1-carboxylate synthase
VNIRLAQKVLQQVADVGCDEVVLCAGARNAPFVALLEKRSGFKIWNFFDERSAGFFALGRSQNLQRPVCVITTSGTAVAELMPAAVEATYTQTPLIFLTADRPREYRGTGAPQSIDQVGIFFRYVETCKDVADLDETLDISDWSKRAPLHVNVCFKEPLLDAPIEEIQFKTGVFTKDQMFATETRRNLEQPLVIVSGLTTAEAEEISPYLVQLGAPIFAESTSNLRNQKELQPLLLKSPDLIVQKIFAQGYCQTILRIGSVPTLRFWRDLEDQHRNIPVFSISEVDFTGLSRPAKHTTGLKQIKNFKIQWTADFRKEIFSLDKSLAEKFQTLLVKYPHSETALLATLSQELGSQNVYVGNSLPIREWDMVCPYGKGPWQNRANRGANGIDGQLSSFFGLADGHRENWALVGDLTAMYDLSALWISNQLPDMDLRIVVINNKGGMIFKNMFAKDIFLNRHEIEFSHWAKMWNWTYQKWDKIPHNLKGPSKTIIELIPDFTESENFWMELKSL